MLDQPADRQRTRRWGGPGLFVGEAVGHGEVRHFGGRPGIRAGRCVRRPRAGQGRAWADPKSVGYLAFIRVTSDTRAVRCGDAADFGGVDGAVRRAAAGAAAVGPGRRCRCRRVGVGPHRRRRPGRRGPGRARRRGRRGSGHGRPAGGRSAAGRPGARRGRQRDVRVHRRRARVDDVHGQPLSLRPGVVEHPGRLHQRVDRGPARAGQADQRLRAGARPSGNGAPRARVQVRAGRSGLPQAVLGHPPRGPR